EPLPEGRRPGRRPVRRQHRRRPAIPLHHQRLEPAPRRGQLRVHGRLRPVPEGDDRLLGAGPEDPPPGRPDLRPGPPVQAGGGGAGGRPPPPPPPAGGRAPRPGPRGAGGGRRRRRPCPPPLVAGGPPPLPWPGPARSRPESPRGLW